MFPDGSLQTTAADGLPTDSLYRNTLFVASGGQLTYTNLTGRTIYITSIHVSGAQTAAYVQCNFAGTQIDFRTPTSTSYLWTGGGVPIVLADGEAMVMTTSESVRMTFVGFKD